MNNTTKVTFEFPSGEKQTFEAIGFVGAMTLSQDGRGAQMGAFATGQFSLPSITGLASAAIEALAKELMIQGVSPEGAEDVLRQILPHAVASATTRVPDARMAALEDSENPILKAINDLLKM